MTCPVPPCSLALDAMKIPYKYELKQLRTPHLNEDGEEVPSAPKRIALLSKLTLLPKSRYKSRESGASLGVGGFQA